MEQVEFKVTKMGCDACVARITAALQGVAGVEVVSVKLGHAVVRRDPAAVSDQEIVTAVRAAGYDATREDERARTI